jgi:hypothetical protein
MVSKMMGMEYDPINANLVKGLFVLVLSTPSHDMRHCNMTSLSFLDCLFSFCTFFWHGDGALVFLI